MKARLITLRISGLVLALVIASISSGAQDTTKTSPSAKPPTADGQTQAAPPAIAAPAPISLPTLAPGPPEVRVPQTAPIPAPPARFSAWTKEVIKMAKAGVGDDVLLTYVDSAGTFNLGADEIVYLRDLGVSSQVMVAMIQHDSDIVSGALPLTMTAPPAPDVPMPMLVAANSDVPYAPAQTAVPSTAAPAQASVPVVASEPAPDQATVAPDPQIAPPATPANTSLFTQENQTPRVQKLVYPVREPNPVELVPPITVLQMPPPERPLTTIAIRFFP
ncbi:MAG TPA: hypothetical protein VN281_22010 [Verrucomicrobiae bacterium]|jgi:hypothetical protein|nr:hypothetical protein [Verrucomicrobiae bacterium]